MQSEITVRRVRPDEAELFRSMRLAALLDAPDAFTETYAEASARPADYWVERVRQSVLAEEAIIVFAQNSAVIGISAGYVRDPGVARLISMWVVPHARGSAASTALVEHVVDWARDVGCHAITLGVTETNAGAFRLYEKCGFHPTDEIKHPIRPGSHLSAVQMIRQIQPRAGTGE
jgi:GNAT superfamily N-acetyltransferase